MVFPRRDFFSMHSNTAISRVLQALGRHQEKLSTLAVVMPPEVHTGDRGLGPTTFEVPIRIISLFERRHGMGDNEENLSWQSLKIGSSSKLERVVNRSQ
jgi:hypothetical protein